AGVPVPADEEIDHQVASDREQPATEGAAPRVIRLALDGPGHRPEDLLDQVGGVGILKPPPPGQAADERGIDFRKLSPRLFIARVPKPDEETGPSGRRFVHSLASVGIYNAGGET